MRQLSCFKGGAWTKVFVHLFQKVAGVQGAEPPAGIPPQSGGICRSKRVNQMRRRPRFSREGDLQFEREAILPQKILLPSKTAGAVLLLFLIIPPLCGISTGDFAGALPLHPASF